jgi:NAD(P)-dependent dehydrogenase (short-subunit alcohol dehydrogenase family)
VSLAASYAPAPLAGCVVLVVDGTTGIGRAITARLCAAGAAVAVVGAGHPGRGDDAATNAAFLCKELAGIGHVALPYQVDAEDTEAVAGLPGQISADIGPVSASIVVVPRCGASDRLVETFHAVSSAVALALPAGAPHIEVDPGAPAATPAARCDDQPARSAVERLVAALSRTPDRRRSA